MYRSPTRCHRDDVRGSAEKSDGRVLGDVGPVRIVFAGGVEVIVLVQERQGLDDGLDGSGAVGGRAREGAGVGSGQNW